MSKAMDALDELGLLEGFVSGHAGEIVTEESFAILRDYITTTEAERAAKEACGGDGADHEDSSENCWNCNGDGVVRDTRNTISASDAQAARIKELEEALKILDSRGGLGFDVHEWIRGIINKTTLSGARKVEPC